MQHSISVSGAYSNNLFRIEATLLLPKEVKAVKGYTAYDITIFSKNPETPVKSNAFTLSLLCDEEMIEAIDVSTDNELQKQIAQYRKATATKESILVLFPDSPIIHHTFTQMVFCYKPDNLTTSFELKY